MDDLLLLDDEHSSGLFDSIDFDPDLPTCENELGDLCTPEIDLKTENILFDYVTIECPGWNNVLSKGSTEGENCDYATDAEQISITRSPEHKSTQSISSWPGKYDFQVIIQNEKKDKNKWTYSEIANKVYLSPNVPVPLYTAVNNWVPCFRLEFIPVFQQDQFRNTPVIPCHNCKEANNDPENKDYIVKVETGSYELQGNRYIVTKQLTAPAQGDTYSIIRWTISCLSSCQGGPNRRQFCIVVNLKEGNEVVGRQVINVKCCKCPSRDLKNDESEKYGQKRNDLQISQNTANKRLKQENACTTALESIMVPKELVPEVKRYINSLMCKKIHKQQNNTPGLLFPEVE